MENPFLISVIVSTYNRPETLRLTLTGLMAQTDQHFEIVVADDGSTKDTQAVVYAAQTQSPVPIAHVWQEDKGFRLARIRNLAAKAAKGEYLIFLDGDCIPPENWVAQHRALAEKGWLITGQRILASEEFTKEILSGSVDVGSMWSLSSFLSWSRQKKVNRFSPALSLSLGPVRKLCQHSWTKPRGCNLAIWKADYLAVRGSDETFQGWGHEDSDLAVRLHNYGVRIKLGIYATAVLHLWHKEAPRAQAGVNWQKVLRRDSEKSIFPDEGL